MSKRISQCILISGKHRPAGVSVIESALRFSLSFSPEEFQVFPALTFRHCILNCAVEYCPSLSYLGALLVNYEF